MGTTSKKLLFCVFLLLLVFRPDASCQLEDLPEEDPQPQTTTRVALQDMNATPGMSFSIPTYFPPADDVQVGGLKLELGFVSENLKFVKLDRGIVPDLLELDVNTDLKTEKNEKGIETSTVTISVSFPSSKTPDKGIINGVLGYLVFRVSEEGRPANIKVRTSGEATELKTGQPIPNFEVADATVEVFAPGDLPVVSCFFFTH